MNRHGLYRVRYWGLSKVTVRVLLNVIMVNLEQSAKLMQARAAPPAGRRPPRAPGRVPARWAAASTAPPPRHRFLSSLDPSP